MDMDKQMQLIKAGNFRENNGSVMRTVNMLRHKYHKLKSVKYALPDVSEGEVLDSINYLYEAGYIHLRSILTKEPATLADCDFEELEAKLTAKGISLLAGGITDPCIVL
ncbi:type VI secretion protein [Ruminococcus sp. Marseille-P6503]|uniref:type VI secretion protein n=1 Tax=Ruminococcus sp. Marseille-P6503 TaxID=2364796 RepID=UPI001FAAE0F1|nr:type VI secretion protein [Ruminococcus sp. Marseille-P6503]